jgi:hypothetical protein
LNLKFLSEPRATIPKLVTPGLELFLTNDITLFWRSCNMYEMGQIMNDHRLVIYLDKDEYWIHFDLLFKLRQKKRPLRGY